MGSDLGFCDDSGDPAEADVLLSKTVEAFGSPWVQIPLPPPSWALAGDERWPAAHARPDDEPAEPTGWGADAGRLQQVGPPQEVDPRVRVHRGGRAGAHRL